MEPQIGEDMQQLYSHHTNRALYISQLISVEFYISVMMIS